MKNFEGSIDVDLFKSSQVDHLFCRVMLPALSVGFLSRDPLSYLEHWTLRQSTTFLRYCALFCIKAGFH